MVEAHVGMLVVVVALMVKKLGRNEIELPVCSSAEDETSSPRDPRQFDAAYPRRTTILGLVGPRLNKGLTSGQVMEEMVTGQQTSDEAMCMECSDDGDDEGQMI